MMIVILVIYGALVLLAAMTGIFGMIFFSDYGRQDEDYKAFKMVFVYSLIWPYAICKVIKHNLDNAEEMDGE